MHSKRDSSENIVLKIRINIRNTNLCIVKNYKKKEKRSCHFYKINVFTTRHYLKL